MEGLCLWVWDQNCNDMVDQTQLVVFLLHSTSCVGTVLSFKFSSLNNHFLKLWLFLYNSEEHLLSEQLWQLSCSCSTCFLHTLMLVELLSVSSVLLSLHNHAQLHAFWPLFISLKLLCSCIWTIIITPSIFFLYIHRAQSAYGKNRMSKMRWFSSNFMLIATFTGLFYAWFPFKTTV